VYTQFAKNKTVPSSNTVKCDMTDTSQFILLKPQFNLKTLVKDNISWKRIMRLLHFHFKNKNRHPVGYSPRNCCGCLGTRQSRLL